MVNTYSNNLKEVMAKIISDDEMLSNFSKLKEFEDMYLFCVRIKGGYTFKEFVDFFDGVADFALNFQVGPNVLQELGDNDSNLVAGGVGGVKKWLAGSLAATSLLAGNTSTFAADAGEVSSPSGSVSVQTIKTDESSDSLEAAKELVASVNKEASGGNDEEKSEETKSFKEAAKEKLKKFGNFVWQNKGKIALGGAAAAAVIAALAFGGYAIYRKSNGQEVIPESVKKKLPGYDQRIWGKRKEADRNRAAEILTNGPTEDDGNGGKKYKDTDITFLRDAYTLFQKHYPSDQSVISAVQTKIYEYDKEHSFLGRTLSAIPVVSGVAALGGIGIGGVKSVWHLIEKPVNELGKASDSLDKVTKVGRSVSDIYEMVKYNKEVAEKKLNEAEYDIDERREQLKKDLAEIKGQEEAKKEAMAVFNSINMERQRLKALGQKGRTNVIVFNGPSGVGKSMCAKALAKALSPGEAYEMSGPAEIDPAKGNLKEQVFGDGSYSSWGGFNFDKVKRGLANYITDNPQGVGIINEYDKINNPSKTSAHPVDEILRPVIDDGKVLSGGKFVDASGFTFILTTNETDGSLKGLAEKQGGILVDPTLKDDDTGSRTVVKHDKSFLNRLRIISFKNLSKEAYKEIAMQEFKPNIDFFASDLGGNLHIEVSDDFYDKIAEFTAARNEGARPIAKLVSEFSSEIITSMLNAAESKNIKKGSQLDSSHLTCTFNFEGINRTFKANVKTPS